MCQIFVIAIAFDAAWYTVIADAAIRSNTVNIYSYIMASFSLVVDSTEYFDVSERRFLGLDC